MAFLLEFVKGREKWTYGVIWYDTSATLFPHPIWQTWTISINVEHSIRPDSVARSRQFYDITKKKSTFGGSFKVGWRTTRVINPHWDEGEPRWMKITQPIQLVLNGTALNWVDVVGITKRQMPPPQPPLKNQIRPVQVAIQPRWSYGWTSPPIQWELRWRWTAMCSWGWHLLLQIHWHWH